jgi:hypothetical protein
MQASGQTLGIEYNRVAMLRSDVMYMTPIDIYNVPDCREGSKGG